MKLKNSIILPNFKNKPIYVIIDVPTHFPIIDKALTLQSLKVYKINVF